MEIDLRRCGFDEFPHRVLDAGGDDEILRLLLLQHQPHHADVVAGMVPVTLGVKVAEVEAVLLAELDAGERPGSCG